jgi:hypothetical protein
LLKRKLLKSKFNIIANKHIRRFKKESGPPGGISEDKDTRMRRSRVATHLSEIAEKDEDDTAQNMSVTMKLINRK